LLRSAHKRLEIYVSFSDAMPGNSNRHWRGEIVALLDHASVQNRRVLAKISGRPLGHLAEQFRAPQGPPTHPGSRDSQNIGRKLQLPFHHTTPLLDTAHSGAASGELEGNAGRNHGSHDPQCSGKQRCQLSRRCGLNSKDDA
jgi:hypothetical protein